MQEGTVPMKLFRVADATAVSKAEEMLAIDHKLIMIKDNNLHGVSDS